MMTDKRDHGIRVGLGHGHHVDGAVKVVKESIGIAHIIAIEGIVILIRTMRVEAENEDVNVIAVVAADVVVTVANDSRQTDSMILAISLTVSTNAQQCRIHFSK